MNIQAGRRFKLYGIQNTTAIGNAFSGFENYTGSGNFQKFVQARKESGRKVELNWVVNLIEDPIQFEGKNVQDLRLQ